MRRSWAPCSSTGVDVNARYDNDLTALMWAAGFGQDEAVKLLLARGAERDARDNRGKTALAIAEDEGRQTTAALLRAGRTKVIE